MKTNDEKLEEWIDWHQSDFSALDAAEIKDLIKEIYGIDLDG